MIRIKETIVVEGKYDKNKLSSLVDGVIIETNGFGIFKDKKRLAMIRRLAEKNGLVILTDSDGAGFLIRGKLCSCIRPELIKNAYIPDILGKEKRKSTPSKEGKLGVEGMELETLRKALLRAGVTVEGRAERRSTLTKVDFYELGLSGRENSAGGADSGARRLALLKRLELPEHLSPNGLLQALSVLYTREELFQLCEELEDDKES